jgi:hypothetical protein
MGIRATIPFLLAAAVLASACGEPSQDRESVTGPDFRPAPPANACDYSGLSTLIRDYFPSGPRANAIIAIKDLMAAAGQHNEDARTYGFQIMDEIGALSRDASVTSDPAAGAVLTVGLIKCMFADASTFTYPTNALADFTKALTAANGGAYYVRGGGTPNANDPPTLDDPAGRAGPVLGTDHEVDPADNLSGVEPVAGNTWSDVLAGNSASEGRALIYGYETVPLPLLEYEWSTIPSSTEFDPGAVVTVCDGTGESETAMVLESGIGVLAYVATTVCEAPQSVTLIERGWGPRALASRLARVVVDAVSPAPLQAATVALLRSGSGGTATTFKSKFKTKGISAIAFRFESAPKTINLSEQPDTVVVRAVTVVDGVTTGVNGVCVYLTGTNNNGQGTSLVGTTDCDNTPTGGLSAQTETRGSAAGYATFQVSVTKTGGLVLTASSTDDTGVTGVVGRDGQTFTSATFKTNVKP